jgi:sensor domain CHASE-containing protein
MVENVNPTDLFLENESLREKLHSLTEIKDELQKSNVLFSQTKQFGNLGYWEWDEFAFRYITGSEQYAAIHDMTVKQMIETITSDEADQELVYEEDREQYIQSIDAARKRR